MQSVPVSGLSFFAGPTCPSDGAVGGNRVLRRNALRRVAVSTRSANEISGSDPLALVNLTRLMDSGSGSSSIRVGIIDGPVDLAHPAFAGSSIGTVTANQAAGCRSVRSEACAHGTAIAGILCASRGSGAPAICPSCTFLVYPIFPEHPQEGGGLASATPAQLAQAIVETIDAGARIINLSLGVIPTDTSRYTELDEAVDHAARRGVILVAAAGNQGRIGFLPLFSHRWVIPVASCDANGTITPESNVSSTIGTYGLRAPGVNILTTAAGGGFAPVSGTSASAAFVTGGIALLWSRSPATPASEMRAIVLRPATRGHRSIVPSLLNVEAAWKSWRMPLNGKDVNMPQDSSPNEIAQPVSETSAAVLMPEVHPAALAPAISARPAPGRVVGQTGSCPTCAGGAAEDSGPPTYVYAIGMIRMRFPSPAIEKEFAQAVAGAKTANLTDQTVLHNALKEHRYLANEVCWSYSVENVDAYILVPRDSTVLDLFVAAVKPSPRGVDTDVIIGTRGPVAPAEMCNGLTVPIVLVDQVYSFEKPDLLKALKKPKELKMTEDQFQPSAEELFERILQMTDNVGATDEHRAMNYLSMRYPQVYTHTAEMYGRDFSLTNIEVTPSRLAGVRKLVNVVLSFTNRATDVVEKYYVRVDVTEKYPFLDKKLSPYFDRD
jgi:PatG C-terminal/Subtilase family